MDRPYAPMIVINAVGLTPRLLPLAPRLNALATAGWLRPLREVLPAVTCTAQASMLTGKTAAGHGVVGNGWYFRETGEVRFWQQSNALIQAPPIYQLAKRQAEARGKKFRAAKLFWWFNQGADVEISVTPKPYYAADGNKAFGIWGTPAGRTEALEATLGPFPFRTFWGPLAGLPSTDWIARCAAEVVREDAPDLTMVYLPHLDYEPQRKGPSGCDMAKLVGELDEACAPLLDAAKAAGARVWVVSEYGHCDVSRPVYLNRILRREGHFAVRPGPFGEVFDPLTSRAFAVCDHQLAHVYASRADDRTRIRRRLEAEPGVARVLEGEARAAVGLDHPRSGELVVLSERDSWFAYPFWLDDAAAPDYARTVDIHRKPGYDPCELFIDPTLSLPKLHLMRRLLQKKLGFRTLFDVTPLDASLVRGSHGLAEPDPLDRPLLIGDGPTPGADLAMTDVFGLWCGALGVEPS
ncbi:alkaline phosphatase family protein [Isosphaeraceae bacterium EP7]